MSRERRPHTSARHRITHLAVLLVICAGLLMLAAGQTIATAGWSSARPLTIGSGLAI
jgi:hypothetical protein